MTAGAASLHSRRCAYAHGTVRWFDAVSYGCRHRSGMMFRAAALPQGTTTLRKGVKVEFSVIDGHKGPQAMGAAHRRGSVAGQGHWPKPDDMATVEDLINLLDTVATICGVTLSFAGGQQPHGDARAGRRLRRTGMMSSKQLRIRRTSLSATDRPQSLPAASDDCGRPGSGRAVGRSIEDDYKYGFPFRIQETGARRLGIVGDAVS